MKVWTRHLWDTELCLPNQGKEQEPPRGGSTTSSPRPAWVRPVMCLFASPFWESSSVTFRWDHVPCFFVLYPRLPMERFFTQGVLKKRCWLRGSISKDFFNHHVKSVANASSVPAYYLLLCKVCFSMISQQCGNPDSTVEENKLESKRPGSSFSSISFNSFMTLNEPHTDAPSPSSLICEMRIIIVPTP